MIQILRENVPEEETWNLTDIFDTKQKWEESLENIDQRLDEKLKQPYSMDSAEELYDSLDSFDQLLEDLNRVSNYARYKFSEDETDSVNQEMMGRNQFTMSKAKKVKVGFVLDLLQIPEKVINKYITEIEELRSFQRFINRVEEIRSHSLSIEMEKTLASLDQTLNSSESIFHAITSSDMKFNSVRDQRGEDVPVSLHMYMTQIETSPDTILRRNAYSSLTNGLKKYQHGLARGLSTEIGKNISLAQLRGYPSALDMHLQYSSPSNDYYATDGMQTDFFEGILDTFKDGLSPHMQRYAKLRKNQLGLDKLLFSDIKAPLDSEYNPRIGYEEAGEIIVAAVAVLGEEYQKTMCRVFEERWVYRADNIGRRMIAFGSGVHGVHGYSFYPWGGSLFDLLLLGHELGHTIHYTLSAENQRIINNSQSQYFIEAPSTLVEHLIVNFLRESRKDYRLQRWLNMYMMMSYHHNCVTHVLEAELLRRLYKLGEDKVPLTTAVINESKGKILTEFWGDTVEIDEGAKLTWMRQPHYYMKLYPFAYSVGMSASTIISQKIKEGNLAVGEQWTNVLKQGGSMNGFELYKLAGIDMSTKENFIKTVNNVGRIVDELENSFN